MSLSIVHTRALCISTFLILNIHDKLLWPDIRPAAPIVLVVDAPSAVLCRLFWLPTYDIPPARILLTLLVI